jgi:hypothetical protein
MNKTIRKSHSVTFKKSHSTIMMVMSNIHFVTPQLTILHQQSRMIINKYFWKKKHVWRYYKSLVKRDIHIKIQKKLTKHLPLKKVILKLK